MEALLSSSSLSLKIPSSTENRLAGHSKSTANVTSHRRWNSLIRNQRLATRIATVDNLPTTAADPAQVQISWQIIVGAVGMFG